MEALKTTRKDLFHVSPLNIVVRKDFNSRQDFGDIDELARQIAEQGVLNPISVRKFKTENGEEKYELIDGERRYRAVMKLIEQGTDIGRIPALLLPVNLDETELIIQQVLRNEGKKFNEYEMGIACQKIMQKGGFTPNEVAKKLGKSKAQVSQWLSLVNIENDDLRNMVKTNVITGGTVRDLLRAHNNDEEKALDEVKSVVKTIEEKQTMGTANNGNGKQETKQETPVKRITMGDFSNNGKTLMYKNTVAIKNGLNIMMSYINEFVEEQKEKGRQVTIDYGVLIDKILHGELIGDALEQMQKNHVGVQITN